MQATAREDWGYALTLLAVVSGSFIVLRLSGWAFLALDFEISVIHLGTVVCLIVYVMKRYRGIVS